MFGIALDKQKEKDIVVSAQGIDFLINEDIAGAKTYIVDYYDIIWSKRGFRVYDIY